MSKISEFCENLNTIVCDIKLLELQNYGFFPDEQFIGGPGFEISTRVMDVEYFLRTLPFRNEKFEAKPSWRARSTTVVMRGIG